MRTTLRRIAVGLSLAALTATAAACSSATADSSDASSGTDAPAASALDGKGEVSIDFWHAMTGKNGEALTQLADQFNAKNKGRVKVNLQFKNTYDDTLSAYKAALNSGQAPDVVQVYDIGTRFMIDSKSTVPVQSFVDADKTTTADIQPNIAATTRSTTSSTRCRSTRRCRCST